MNIATPQPSIKDLIAAAGDRLTATERRIVKAVIEDRTLLAFGTVTDLASRVGTSRASIMRFATKLGFGGYTDLQDYARAGMAREISRPSERIRHSDTFATPARVVLERALGSVFEATEGDRLTALARPIVNAANVWILSGETSQAGAHALHSGLSMIRPGVHLIEEHASARDLSSACPGDVAVVFDFARYRRHAITVARALANHGVKIVAITDGPLSPLAALTDTWCELKVPGVGPFDSSIPAVAIAELLVAHIANELHDTAREHIDRTEALWEATGAFLP
jgi:DNA-binding MurR/RpiR family transcriptional regulator